MRNIRQTLLLCDFMQSARTLPPDAYAVHDAKAIPPALRRVSRMAQLTGRSCSCWTDERAYWIFVGELLPPDSQVHDAPVLRVEVYGTDGQLTETGTWLRRSKGDWHRCEVCATDTARWSE